MHQLTQDDLDDDRPIAVRRKRRMSTALASPHRETQANSSDRGAPNALKTPTKPKKRVRFSDPGLETITTTSSSTGITPFIERTTLRVEFQESPPSSPRLLARTPRRRLSLPVELAVNHSASIPSPPLSGEIQFAPLRQVLDDRSKRRLRRNNLSDEINEIEQEKKEDVKRRMEIRDLKEELALARQLGSEVIENAPTVTGNQERIQELENEILALKEEIRERSMTAASSPATHDDDQVSTPNNDMFDVGLDDTDFIMVHQDDYTQPEIGKSASEMGIQTLVTSSEAESLQNQFDQNMSHLVKARLELEHICPGETTLGLTVTNADTGSLLNALLDRLRDFRARLILLDATTATTQMQESNLRSQFNAVLQQLDRARSYGEEIAAQNKASILKAEAAEGRARASEADVIEKEQTISKLQRALDSYRTEVSNLESLVTRLEADHENAVRDLRAEMDEAVADLECHVTAETQGRREAEAECEQHLLKIRELETMEAELKQAVYEKQSLIRSLEEEAAKAKEAKEVELGGLNVKIGQLVSTSEGFKADLAKLETEKSGLVHRLEEERQAGSKAMLRVRDEMKRCLNQIETVQHEHMKDAQSRGAEVAEHKGLLTPTSAVRFRDTDTCEGRVEVHRGKSRTKRGIDSGIGILEEDEDEDMTGVNL
ncbi:MAG: hypothetical protein Q9187_007554 [Circinaria calcarea]